MRDLVDVLNVKYKCLDLFILSDLADGRQQLRAYAPPLKKQVGHHVMNQDATVRKPDRA